VLFLALAAFAFGGSREPGLTMVVLCGLAAILATAGLGLLVWGLAYQRLTYVLDDDQLRIAWLGRMTVVPYAAIQGIYTGQRLQGEATPDIFTWPGINVGPARVRGLGRLRFYATSTDQAELTLITVEHGGVVLSAREPTEFRAALIERVEQSELSTTANPEARWQHLPPRTAPWTALADPWLGLLASLGVVLVLVIVGIVGFRFDALPDQIVMHFDATGRPNQIASKFDLLRVAFFGVIVLLIDWGLGIWLHPLDRLLARLLWLGGVLVQLVLVVGVLRLVA
jgi:hypothetical protein